MTKKPSESYIEKAVCRYAESIGWLQYKFVSPARRGVPDRIFMKKGVVLFIEFKTWGGVATKQQEYHHDKIRDQGIRVYVIDNEPDGIRLLKSESDSIDGLND